jgi:hypothetical protein
MERLIIFKFTVEQFNQFRHAYNEGEISRITSNIQQTTYLPIVEDTLCSWCMGVITGIPKHIYRDLDNKKINKIGQFCDNVLCQFAFNKIYCKNIYWEFIRSEIFTSTGKIISKVHYPDAPQLMLQRFGGTYTTEDYKKYMQQLEKTIG